MIVYCRCELVWVGLAKHCKTAFTIINLQIDYCELCSYFCNALLLQPLDDKAKALIYTVAVCYHARLSNREPFEERITQQFPANFCDIDAERFQKEIERLVAL